MEDKLSKKEYLSIIIALAVAGAMFFGLSRVYQMFFSKDAQLKDVKTNNVILKEENKVEEINNKQENKMQNTTEDKKEIIKASVGDTVVVNYTGKFTDGKIFDSSIPRKQPFPVTLGQHQVIVGWEEGLLGKSIGDKFTLTLPPEKAYGPNGISGVIPPNSTLVFDIEVLDIQRK